MNSEDHCDDDPVLPTVMLNLATCRSTWQISHFFADKCPSPLLLPSVIPGQVDRITSQSWSVPCWIDGNMHWNFLWASACRYSSPFCPLAGAKSAPSEAEGVCMLFQNRKLTYLTKSLNAAVTTGLDRCCHPVDTIFAVFGFSLLLVKKATDELDWRLWLKILLSSTGEASSQHLIIE